MGTTVSLIAFAYALGSVSSAILVCRLFGHSDPRVVGSKNPGTTNVLRTAGKTAAAVTLAGDVGKGVIPVLVCRLIAPDPFSIAAVGCAAFLGHLFPVYFGFHGGKGVATFIGVLFAFGLQLGAVFVVAWLAVAGTLRYSSLAALTAAVITPVAAYWLGTAAPIVAGIIVMDGFVFWRHKTNIQNLLRGKESKIGRNPG